MAVGVADYECFAEADLRHVIRDDAGRNKVSSASAGLAGGGIGVVGQQDSLAMDDIVGVLIGRKRPAVARGEVFQQFDSRTACASQRGNAQVSAEYVVQMLLFGAVVFTLSRYVHAKEIAIK